MRRAAKIDRNQGEIVEALRKAGATVQPLHTVGKGCPDLLVGYAGRNLLIEIKDGTLYPSQRRLTDDEHTWVADWRGEVAVVLGIEDALRVLRG